jgi:hypothetical protein
MLRLDIIMIYNDSRVMRLGCGFGGVFWFVVIMTKKGMMKSFFEFRGAHRWREGAFIGVGFRRVCVRCLWGVFGASAWVIVSKRLAICTKTWCFCGLTFV